MKKIEIQVPALGESITEATVAKWFIKKGFIVAEKVFLTMSDLYDKNFLDEYRGNPNWAGDD